MGEGTPVVDANDDHPAGLQAGDADDGAEGKAAMGGRQSLASKASPLAVRFCSFGRYQEAGPVWVKIGTSASGSCLGAVGGGGKLAVAVQC